jgi:hypothetical protein
MRDYEAAVELLEGQRAVGEFVGARPLWVVEKAEAALGHRFPASYRRFLLEYGAGNVGAFEVYGILGDDLARSGIPNGIWLTQRLRAQGALPAELVVVSDVGDGACYCLDLATSQPDAPVVVFEPASSPPPRPWGVVAEDFGAFFLDGVRRYTA